MLGNGGCIPVENQSGMIAVVVVLIGVLGGLLAKELRLFGTEPEKMDRQYTYEQKQKSLF